MQYFAGMCLKLRTQKYLKVINAKKINYNVVMMSGTQPDANSIK